MLRKINNPTLFLLIFAHLFSTEIHADDISAPLENLPAVLSQPEHFRIHTVNPNKPAITTGTAASTSIDLKQKSILFNGIAFRGLSIFQPVDLIPLYEGYLGAAVDTQTLQKIVNAIVKKYNNLGYTNVTAAVSEQKIRNGLVRIEVSEGHISRVHLVGDLRGKKSYLTSFFDKLPLNQPVNSKTLEHTMLLLNDLPGIVATSRIVPIEDMPKQFELLVDITQTRLSGDITINNRGSKLIGETLGAISLNSYAAFKQFEQIQLTVASSSQNNELDYYVLNTSWPISNKGTQLKFDLAHTEAMPGDFLEPLNIIIKTSNSTVGIYHPLYRQKSKSIFLDGKINYYKSDTSIQQEASATDRIYTLRLRVDFLSIQAPYYFNQFAIGINQSLHGLDKLNETSQINDSDINSTNKESFSVLHLEYFGKYNLSQKWLLSYRINGQYADKSLPSSETFTFSDGVIGGAYDPSEIYGDHGLAGKTTIQYRLKSTFFEQSKLWLYSSYDIARVWDIDTDENTSAASLAIGFKISSSHFTGTLEIAKPLTRDVSLEGEDGDKARGFASLRYSF